MDFHFSHFPARAETISCLKNMIIISHFYAMDKFYLPPLVSLFLFCMWFSQSAGSLQCSQCINQSFKAFDQRGKNLAPHRKHLYFHTFTSFSLLFPCFLEVHLGYWMNIHDGTWGNDFQISRIPESII